MLKVNDTQVTGRHYLPHHGVIKQTSVTTKLRVVFDGSAKSTTGVSLNDTLMVGPTIQDDIFSLLLRFRQHEYVLTGDIEKMYRQILIRPEDRKYLNILWREGDGSLATYELQTVTFGLSAAPFLAIRCLQQLAEDEGSRYPLAAPVLKRDLYVDDLLTGATTLEGARQLRDEIITLLQAGGFNLRQCASNSADLLDGLPIGNVTLSLDGQSDSLRKTLGVCWQSERDSILYTVQPLTEGMKITKRTILSEVAKIFDPLGLLNPVVVQAKLIIQDLWQLNLNWDESVPTEIYTRWIKLANQLTNLNNVEFDRKVITTGSKDIQLHGFCDASERAYGACVYLRCVDAFDNITTQLLCAKSRVAPLKNKQTIPRLELCAAQLLANLLTTIKNATVLSKYDTILWTDSTIVLHWINTPPHTLKTYVSNRVTDVQNKTTDVQWRHVRTYDNPADLLSRGMAAQDLLRSTLWRRGPSWLSETTTNWPHYEIRPLDETPEKRKVTCFAITHENEPRNSLLQRYSSFTRLLRISAYCLRFKRRRIGALGADELEEARDCIIRVIQASSFNNEIEVLRKGENVHPKSKLLALSPFLDERGIIRVGGRLQQSALTYGQRHPIILPKSNYITDLIIRKEHTDNHHSGIQTTLANVRHRYWPIDGRNQTRKIIRQCVRCFRAKPPTTDYIMGRLPTTRVTESRPFTHVGVDYCGPFFIKEKKLRNRNRIKVYVAVFICLAVKAVHLEVVSDLTTEAFLAALRRFMARRGKCKSISSDNGTNFVGANREMEDIRQLIQSKEHNDVIQQKLVNEGITWHFNPPLAPHCGGIWEAAVKSFKHHLRRVMGNELFTYEQLETLTVEIEAILNSRPLTPLSADPNDPQALTPGHVLIGDTLNSIPEQDFRDTPTNRLSVWQHIQKVRQDFWSRWYKEYINELNIRHKWTKGEHRIQRGSIVVIKDDNIPPLRWLLGRVVEVYPGKDGIIRTVKIKTSSSTLERNVKKIAPLPIEL